MNNREWFGSATKVNGELVYSLSYIDEYDKEISLNNLSLSDIAQINGVTAVLLEYD